MATQVTVPPQESVSADALLQFLRVCDEAAEKLKNGVAFLVLPGTAICPLGLWATCVLKQHLEEKFKIGFTVSANAAANTVTIIAVEPTPSSGLSDDQPAVTPTSSPGRKRKSAAKVPRPKNAFMIYRLDWHQRVVDLNPTMHNTDISKIIGNMWKTETPDMIAAYKARAEEEKRQHAIAHPDYQYQPRKPSEKKKRMTKNKAAKLDTVPSPSTVPAGEDGNLAYTPSPRQLDLYDEAFVAFEQAMLVGNQKTADATKNPFQTATTTAQDTGVDELGSLNAFRQMHSFKFGHVTDAVSRPFNPLVEQGRQEQIEMNDVLDFLPFGDMV